MNRFDRFFDMGGYAEYVWPAYGVALLILGGLMVFAVLRYRKAVRAFKALEQSKLPDLEEDK